MNATERKVDADRILGIITADPLYAAVVQRLAAWVAAGCASREEGDPPLSDRLYHGTAAARSLDEPCALDIAIEDIEVSADRRRLIKAARAAGYIKPCGRGAGMAY